MIDLFCLLALSLRRHIKANFLSGTIRDTWVFVKLKDYLYKAFTPSYLPRCPCHLNRASRSLHRIPALSILTGRCSARRSDPGCISRCCCTARGSRLSTHHVRVKQRSESEQGNQEDKGRVRKKQEQMGPFRVYGGRGGTKMIKDSTEWTYSTYTSDRTGNVGEAVRGYSRFTWASGPRSATVKSEMCEAKEDEACWGILLIGQWMTLKAWVKSSNWLGLVAWIVLYIKTNSGAKYLFYLNQDVNKSCTNWM